MKKRIYSTPLSEVEELKFSTVVLAGSIPDDVTPPPPGWQPGAPKRRTPVF